VEPVIAPVSVIALLFKVTPPIELLVAVGVTKLLLVVVLELLMVLLFSTTPPMLLLLFEVLVVNVPAV